MSYFTTLWISFSLCLMQGQCDFFFALTQFVPNTLQTLNDWYFSWQILLVCFPMSILPFFLTNEGLICVGSQCKEVNTYLPRFLVSRKDRVTYPIWAICKQRSNKEVAGKTSFRGKTAGATCSCFVLCILPFTQNAVMTLMWFRHIVIFIRRAGRQKEPGSLMALISH